MNPTTPIRQARSGPAPHPDRVERAFAGLSPFDRWLVWQIHVLERPVEEVTAEVAGFGPDLEARVADAASELQARYGTEP